MFFLLVFGIPQYIMFTFLRGFQNIFFYRICEADPLTAFGLGIWTNLVFKHMTVSKNSGPFWAGTRTKAETPIKIRSQAFVRFPAQNGPDYFETVICLSIRCSLNLFMVFDYPLNASKTPQKSLQNTPKH